MQLKLPKFELANRAIRLSYERGKHIMKAKRQKTFTNAINLLSRKLKSVL